MSKPHSSPHLGKENASEGIGNGGIDAYHVKFHVVFCQTNHIHTEPLQ